jgi:RNA polymerase sigma factor (sigma-70 family)
LIPDDTADLLQSVWLILFGTLESVRDPLALRGWIRTVARNICCEMYSSGRRTVPYDFSEPESEWPSTSNVEDAVTDEPAVDHLLREECIQAVRRGLAELTPPQRKLLLLLAAEPRPSYQAISTEMGMPIGSIGPTRARLLARLAGTEPVRCLIDTSSDTPAEAA